ncbi:hypothetical protein HZA97_00700 [Candidatus Woesearchaeota archaeon]|nr:hypothetical protein [Candidatus Woesearchaeota archaeon]
MSLEDLLKKSNTGEGFKEKTVHYSKYIANSLYRSAIDVFRFPTAKRLKREALSSRNPTFLEEVITATTNGSVQVFVMGSLFFCPPLGLTALGTNTASYVYENHFRKNKKVVEKESFLSRFVNKFRNLPRKIAKYACAYTLIGSLALGHFYVSNNKGIKQYNPNLINVEVQKISLEKEGKTYEFYLLGELHLYNYSSSVYATKLIEQKDISLLLSEGVDRSGPPTVEDLKNVRLPSGLGWRDVCETALGMSYVVMALGSGYVYYSPSEICYDKGIQVIFLEKPAVRKANEESTKFKKEAVKENKTEENNFSEGKITETFTDGREGISDLSYLGLGALGVTSLAAAPTLYFFIAPARYFSFPKYVLKLPIGLVFSGILNKRNELMAKNALEHITEDPRKVCLMRVGAAHLDGIIEEFKKYGEVKVEKVDLNFK